MSEDQVERIMSAAYGCFAQHGYRKTTMDDIATAAGMSRPAVYQYVKNKRDAFRRVAGGTLEATMGEARAAADGGGTLTQRLDRVLAVKLASTARLLHDGPHAMDLIAANADLDRAFRGDLLDLLAATIMAAASDVHLNLSEGHAREVAELALALARGLEVDLVTAGAAPASAEAGGTRERLRNGLALLVAGLAAATDPARS